MSAKARSSTPVRKEPESVQTAAAGSQEGPSSNNDKQSAPAPAAPAAAAPAAAAQKPKLGVIYLTVFLDFFANGVVLPVLQNHARSLGASGFNVGMVFTAYSAAQIPGSFLFGRLSDFKGRRPVIIVSLFMSSVTLLMTLAAPNLQALILARGVAGFFSETSVCQAYIADKTTREQRAAALGHMGAFIGLAFVVGPATGAVLGIFGGFSLAVQFTAVVTALNLVYAWRKLDESLPDSAPSSHAGETLGLKDLAVVLQRPLVMCVIIAQFATTLAFMGWDTTFAVWAAERLGYTQRHTGWAFSWLAVGFFVASWKTRAFAKNPENTSLGSVLGCSMMAAGLLGHRLVRSTLSSLAPLFAIGFGYALSEIIFQTLVSVHSPKGLQGSTLGVLSAAQALARAVAPIVTGYLFDSAPQGDLDFAYMVLAAAPAAATLSALAPRPSLKAE